MNLESALLHLQQDTKLHGIIQKTDVPPFLPSGNVYFDLLESIVSQQLSIKAAATIFNRFCALFPEEYPHPQLLVNINPELLRNAGVSNQKATYLKNVARFTMENDLAHFNWNNLSDAEAIQFLTQIKGVGHWTAEIVLIFTLGRPDILPVGDLGIQQAMVKLYNLPETGKNLHARMQEVAEPWRPYRSIACRYLWYWKDNK